MQSIHQIQNQISKTKATLKPQECWSRNSHSMCTSNLKLTNQSHIKAKGVLEKEVTEV